MNARDIESRSLAREFAKGAAGNVLLLGGNTFLNFMVAVVLSRALGAAALGIYAFAGSLTSILTAPVTSALGTMVLRETAGSDARGIPAEARRTVEWGVVTALWLVGGLTLLIGAGIMLASGDVADEKTRTVLYALALPIPMALLYVFSGAARGLGGIVIGRLPDLILRPLFLIVILLALSPLPSLGPFSAAQAMQFQIWATFAALAFAFVIVWRAYQARSEAKLATAAAGPPASRSREWFASLLPLALVYGLTSIQTNMDILMLDWYLTSEQVGIYRAGSQAGRLYFAFATAIGTALSPYVARLHASADKAAMQRLLLLASRGSLAVLLPAFGLAVAFNDWILTTAFGPAFSPGADVFVIIAAGAVLQCLLGYSTSVLSMTGRVWQMVPAVAASIGLNFVLNLALIPLYGIDGAAIATTVSGAVLSVLLAIQVARSHKLRTWALG